MPVYGRKELMRNDYIVGKSPDGAIEIFSQEGFARLGPEFGIEVLIKTTYRKALDYIRKLGNYVVVQNGTDTFEVITMEEVGEEPFFAAFVLYEEAIRYRDVFIEFMNNF